MWCLALPPLAAEGKGKASHSYTLAHLASLGQHWGPVLPVICTLGGWAAHHLPSTVCKAGNISAKNGEKHECHLKMTNCWSNALAHCVCNSSKYCLPGHLSTGHVPSPLTPWPHRNLVSSQDITHASIHRDAWASQSEGMGSSMPRGAYLFSPEGHHCALVSWRWKCCWSGRHYWRDNLTVAFPQACRQNAP